MRIDSHQHFWKYNKVEYSWIGSEMDTLKRDFLPGDLLPDLERSCIDGTIAVQARQTVEETKWLLDLAEKNRFIKGVVGWVDLCSDNVDNQLAELHLNKSFVGVRHVLQDEEDNRFMLRPDFLNGISLLKKYDLVYDLLILPHHLKIASEFVELFPDQVFVLDHIAKPLIRENILSPWKEDLKKLAQHQNVYCKLSGMVTEASWKGWKRENFIPYLDAVLSSFGPLRLMTGSDWPVCTVAAGYAETMSVVEDYISSMSSSEKEMIMGVNAVRVYGINKQS